MNRRESRGWHKPEEKTNLHGFKAFIEKVIILVAFFVIMGILFLVPKYEAYQMNREILEEKNNRCMEYPKEMKEETYLEELSMIRKSLEESRRMIPETIDTAELYGSLTRLTEESDIELVSVAFKPISTIIDENLGIRIRPDFTEDENQTIIGPDQRYLGYCSITLVCTGDLESCIYFLQGVKNHEPLIKVRELDLKETSSKKKTMTLKLESYGILDQTADKLEK